MSAFWLNTTCTIDSPGLEEERTVSTPAMPFTADSIGNVIRVSTSSGERPSALVCTSTWGGANGGNTSRGIWPTASTPQMLMTNAAATINQRRAIENRSVELSSRSSIRLLAAAQPDGSSGQHYNATGGQGWHRQARIAGRFVVLLRACLVVRRCRLGLLGLQRLGVER